MFTFGGEYFSFFLLSEGLREVQTHWVLSEQGVCLQFLTLMDLSKPASPIRPAKMLVSSPLLFFRLSSLGPVFFIHTKVFPSPPSPIDLENGPRLLEPEVPGLWLGPVPGSPETPSTNVSSIHT